MKTGNNHTGTHDVLGNNHTHIQASKSVRHSLFTTTKRRFKKNTRRLALEPSRTWMPADDDHHGMRIFKLINNGVHR
jgi:ribosomal protein L28